MVQAGRLCRPAALSEGGAQQAGSARRRQGRRAMKALPTDDPLLRPGHDPPRTAARSTTCTCSRPRPRTSRRAVGLLQDGPHHPGGRGLPADRRRATARSRNKQTDGRAGQRCRPARDPPRKPTGTFTARIQARDRPCWRRSSIRSSGGTCSARSCGRL
jgi:hypothetical protein